MPITETAEEDDEAGFGVQLGFRVYGLGFRVIRNNGDFVVRVGLEGNQKA